MCVRLYVQMLLEVGAQDLGMIWKHVVTLLGGKTRTETLDSGKILPCRRLVIPMPPGHSHLLDDCCRGS